MDALVVDGPQVLDAVVARRVVDDDDLGRAVGQGAAGGPFRQVSGAGS